MLNLFHSSIQPNYPQPQSSKSNQRSHQNQKEIRWSFKKRKNYHKSWKTANHKWKDIIPLLCAKPPQRPSWHHSRARPGLRPGIPDKIPKWPKHARQLTANDISLYLDRPKTCAFWKPLATQKRPERTCWKMLGNDCVDSLVLSFPKGETNGLSEGIDWKIMLWRLTTSCNLRNSGHSRCSQMYSKSW